jgi:hypothetical protein
VRLSVAGANHNRELALKIVARVHHRRGGMPSLPETDDQGAAAGDAKHDIPKPVVEPAAEDNGAPDHVD